MNRELQGWQLVLALLVPVLVIGGAGWVAYQVLSDDPNQELAIGDDQGADVATATPMPETQPVADPTALPLPTPITVPTLAPGTPTPVAAPTATAVPAPQPTSRPAPTASGPAPTATANPNIVTVTCGGTVPTEIERGKSFGPLSVVVSPASAANTMQYVWNVGKDTTVPGPTSGTITYDALGDYTIRVTGTNIATQAQLVATCGTVKVTPIDAPIKVTCSVKPQNPAVQWKDAKPGDALTVTLTWTPADVKLTLQYEFETFDPVVFSNNASPGDSKTHTFASTDGTFSIFWRYPETGETGRLECPAFPDTTTATPAPTAAATATPAPTAVATATATPTATPTP